MELEFAKLDGLGNDFVFIDDRARELELTDDEVRWLCDRHVGIGADGVILVRPPVSEGAAGYMHYINSDGTLAQMCGNGVRCFAKYLVDRGIAPAGPEGGSLIADTLAGPRAIDFSVDGEGRMTAATVDMGAPVLDPALIPVDATATATAPFGAGYVRDLALDSPWGPFTFTCVSMGNPHAVCFLDDLGALPDALFPTGAPRELSALDVDAVGSWFEAHPAFPEKVNVEFAQVGEDGIAMRVYERGCGETLACGTGACATAVAACLTGRTGCESDVVLRGGVLRIRWDDDGHVRMTGPATQSFTGTVSLERA
ncbi:MAG: diaminopimelate epimerase [Eggerthellaceae bacterium]|nr:diaminopimelate epimerase [Eggerthellaceae bacterium]